MRRSLSVPLAGLLFALAAAPALAQPPTTPVPGPRDPDQPPASAPNGAQSLAHAVGDAGTGLSVVRLGPGGVPTSTILPGLGEQLPKQSVTEFGLGLASAQVNTEAFLTTERVVTQASPFGFAVAGRSPQSPGTLVQTAIPDNPRPATGGLPIPETPLAKLSLLNGSVHARWDDKLGPCVSPLATARTSLAGLQVLSALPAEVPLPVRTSLVSIPDTFEASSVVRLVDLPGSGNKAVESTSTMRAAGVELAGGIKIDVISPPTLTATATGDETTSKITYTAPVLKVSQNGKELGTLDAARPTLDIPLLLDLVVVKLQIAGLNEKKAAFTGNGFSGFQLGATARMLDVQLLPTDKLKLPNLPTALAQISLGEQIVRAAAPRGGVVCGTAQPPRTTAPEQPGGPAAPPVKAPPLAQTNAAYQSIPLFWTGTGLLLAGVVLVAALPARGRSRTRPPGTSQG
ncbi:hypothetical protein SAMN05216188_102725 [Lentzea xinjiangensis]|uniref:Uncharacterized protein n=1 Tax=Lentzea xinjiangensis TaxID=402600 RepID=A0A1H9EZ40_9PSEU|nr:hypothetical protein [Lentzea xinjiangensis]SEQ30994.1 hypothetical protein SAMN05216188_102725 [Lentzea xinjiangensis]